MTKVQLTETGRVVWADDDVARRWIATGYAVPFVTVVEVTSRTTAPSPPRMPGVETR
jgi:hypothetical protein